MGLLLEIKKNDKIAKIYYHSLYTGKEKSGFAADAAKKDTAIYEKAARYKLIEKNIQNLDNPDIVVFGELPYYRNAKKIKKEDTRKRANTVAILKQYLKDNNLDENNIIKPDNGTVNSISIIEQSDRKKLFSNFLENQQFAHCMTKNNILLEQSLQEIKDKVNNQLEQNLVKKEKTAKTEPIKSSDFGLNYIKSRFLLLIKYFHSKNYKFISTPYAVKKHVHIVEDTVEKCNEIGSGNKLIVEKGKRVNQLKIEDDIINPARSMAGFYKSDNIKIINKKINLYERHNIELQVKYGSESKAQVINASKYDRHIDENIMFDLSFEQLNIVIFFVHIPNDFNLNGTFQRLGDYTDEKGMNAIIKEDLTRQLNGSSPEVIIMIGDTNFASFESVNKVILQEQDKIVIGNTIYNICELTKNAKGTNAQIDLRHDRIYIFRKVPMEAPSANPKFDINRYTPGPDGSGEQLSKKQKRN
jgi:hypothetical protein